MTFAFADREAGFFGLARAGVADGQGSALGVLFAGREPVSLVAEGGHAVEDADWDDLNLPGLTVRTLEPHARWQVVLATRAGLRARVRGRLAARGVRADSAAMAGHERLCRVRGTAAGRPIDCLGQRGRSWGTADWSEIALTRSLGAWLDEGRRSSDRRCGRRARQSHAEEAQWGALLDARGRGARCADPRLSTTYDGDGHQRRAGLELWVGEDDDYPRRGAGQVLCGSSVELGPLRLDLAFFGWTLDGRRGVGRYDVLRRA